ncbi:GDSL esterase/lipase 7, partial [Bienertia sinuspersici]
SCVSMDGQIELFQKTIVEELVPMFEGPTELYQYLGDSIFIIWAGSNDYLLNYFSGLSPEYNNKEIKGARKIVVLEVGPLGCLPIYRKKGGHDETWCDESKNANATMFNTRLAPMLHNLSSDYPDSYFTLGKLYELTDDVFKHPSNYGMTNVSSSCCVTGPFLGNLACYPFMDACADPEKHLFWDGAHPTQASHQLLATPCFNGSNVCVPNNIQQLVQLKAKTATFLHSAA